MTYEYSDEEAYEYSDEEVKEDIRDFFQNADHWVYKYGSPSESSPDSPYHRKQIVVLLEKKYFHWLTDRVVNLLLVEGFLEQAIFPEAHFVYRADIRYIKREINKRRKLIKRYTDPYITRGIGCYAETLFEYALFRTNGFTILGRNTNKYGGKKWIKTGHDLDFIIEKDSIVYGVEVKNTLGYMEQDEFEIKLQMCNYLGINPLWILRNAPKNQFDQMKEADGFILKFGAQIYPPTQEPLVRDIWNLMRLPVAVWKEIPLKVINLFLRHHNRLKSKKTLTKPNSPI
jgi:hypothetical protein